MFNQLTEWVCQSMGSWRQTALVHELIQVRESKEQKQNFMQQEKIEAIEIYIQTLHAALKAQDSYVLSSAPGYKCLL